MPTCNKINCAITLPPTNTALPEYRRRYLDSSVSVYVPVPDLPILHAAPSFNIHLWADGYIAPGLAMFVYIDGFYQCNRSKRMPSSDSPGGGRFEMKLRQKEEKVAGGEGDFVGREWRWVDLAVEQANEATGLNRDMQDCIGKVEVVVLRCDDDGAPMVTPRAQAPLRVPSATRAPATAPSAKAPSMKAPSVAASEGLGGLFGLFDGACDAQSSDTICDSSDDTSDDNFDNHGLSRPPLLQRGEQCSIPLGLDGHEYEHPGVVVNQYGQMMDSRVPYHHTSGARTPGNIDYRYDVNANARHVSLRERIPERRPAHRPRTFIGSDGRRYEIVDQQQETPTMPTYVPALQRPPTPVYQATTHARTEPQARRQLEAIDHHAPRHNRPIYVDPTSEVRYTTHRDLMTRLDADPQRHIQQHPSYKEQIPYHTRPAAQEMQMIDPEYQRYLIFQMPERVEGLFEVDHKFVAEAVAHMSLLKTTPIFDLRFEEMQKLKRKLRKALDRGHWPNGVKIGVEHSRMHETRARVRSPHAGSRVSGHKRVDKSQKQDGFGNSTDRDIPTVNESGLKHGTKLKHDDSKDGRYSSTTVEHFASEEKSHHGSNRSQIASGSDSDWVPWGDNTGADAKEGEAGAGWSKDDGGDKTQGVEGTGDWNLDKGDQKHDKGGGTGWDTGKNTGDDQGAFATWDAAASEKHRPQAEVPQAGNGAGSRSHTQRAPSSHHSKMSTSTNPHAHVQSYFQTWRGNGQAPATKPPPRQPREPYAYPAASIPHIAASQVGDRSHGVRAGKGADYTHRTRRPKYLDTMDDPYAVFVFNYRSVEKLEEILHQNVSGDMAAVAEEVSRGVLMNLPRERLVEELMQSQARAAPVVREPVSTGHHSSPEPRAKSIKSGSNGQGDDKKWAQPNIGQNEIWAPDDGGNGKNDNPTPKDPWDNTGKGSVKGGKAVSAWNFAGEGNTGQGGFKGDIKW